MNKLLGTVVVVLLTAAGVSAQSLTRTYTRPSVPPQEALDRLNLKLGWRVYVPMDGFRDGFLSIQLLGDQILVQCRSGGIGLLDATTGATLWRARPGTAYQNTQPLGWNKRSVFVLNANRLFALDRGTGVIQWEFTLPDAASAPPVADDEAVYLCLGQGHIYVYGLPDPAARPTGAAEKPAQLEAVPESMVRREAAAAASTLVRSGRFYHKPVAVYGPRLLWDVPIGTLLEQAPILSGDYMTLAGADGSFFTSTKTINRILYSFKSDATVSAPLGQYGTTAYIASQDFNVYAMDIEQGRILWRVLGGAPILKKPMVTDEELFVTPERAGVYRLDRTTGQRMWRYPEIVHFLAANKKFVYGLDAQGSMHILERVRGILLSVEPGTRDFVFPVSNDVTDRIYLASNDGLLLSLHDRDYPRPLLTKNVAVKKDAKDKDSTDDKPKDTGKAEGVEAKK